VIAIGGAATGVTLRGCTWNLTGADLDPYAALGVSNIVESTPVTCGVEGGVALVCVQA
jgi:thiamine pyrophosphokinase